MTAEAREKMQCRYIKSDGHPCRGLALRGHLYCFTHGRDFRRQAAIHCSPAQIQVPRLDNRADIQQLITDVARALAAGTIDHATARLLMAAARLASRHLPPPPALAALTSEETAPEPVEEVVTGPNGEDLAPKTPYLAGSAKAERKWSFSEFLYHSVYPGNENKPLPESGYLRHDAESGTASDPAGTKEEEPGTTLEILGATAAVPKYHPRQSTENKHLPGTTPEKLCRKARPLPSRSRISLALANQPG
jgi:hypothetical protein